MKKFRVISQICLFLSSVVIVAADYGQEENPLMPVGFEKVRLGMTWSDVVLVRPRAVVLDVMPDTAGFQKPDPMQPHDGLQERIVEPESLFRRAVFGFDNGVLVNIMITGGSKDLDEKRNALFGEFLAKSGMPTSTAPVMGRNGEVIATWIWNDKIINVSLAIWENEESMSILAMQIITKSYAKKLGATWASDEKPKPIIDSRVPIISRVLSTLQMKATSKVGEQSTETRENTEKAQLPEITQPSRMRHWVIGSLFLLLFVGCGFLVKKFLRK